MDTSEKIVEAYVRHVKRWATISNIGCGGQKEIDLFAIDPKTGERWHIETSVSIASGFSKLTAKEFAVGDHKDRVKGPGARRTVDFFLHEKFDHAHVDCALAELGCTAGQVKRVIVTWDATDDALARASELGLDVWLLPDLLQAILDKTRQSSGFFSDDTIRTLMLTAKALKH